MQNWKEFKKEHGIHDFTQIVSCEKSIQAYIAEILRYKQDMIYMDEVNKSITIIMDEIRDNTTLSRKKEDKIELIILEQIELLCDCPQYRNYN